jgi:hypothetical protein
VVRIVAIALQFHTYHALWSPGLVIVEFSMPRENIMTMPQVISGALISVCFAVALFLRISYGYYYIAVMYGIVHHEAVVLIFLQLLSSWMSH